MRISDWSSDVCSSDLGGCPIWCRERLDCWASMCASRASVTIVTTSPYQAPPAVIFLAAGARSTTCSIPSVKTPISGDRGLWSRSEEHTSELQSLMRISYAVFCLKKKKEKTDKQTKNTSINTQQRQ